MSKMLGGCNGHFKMKSSNGLLLMEVQRWAIKLDLVMGERKGFLV